MLHKTQGIVLRTIKYGDTSLVCHVFTELFGLQTYLVKGVRSSKKGGNKANILHPASVLDMVVYHQPQKNFQLIKEYQQAATDCSYHEDVVRNCIALFAMEVLSQFITGQDVQPDLFYFTTDFLQHLDTLPLKDINNLPLFFLIQVGKMSGYQFSGRYSAETPHLNLSEGRFTDKPALFPPFIEAQEAALISNINQCNSVPDVTGMGNMDGWRRSIMQHFLLFFKLHVPHFKDLRSLPVLITILEES